MASPKDDPNFAHFQRIPWCWSLMQQPQYSLRCFSTRLPTTRKENTFMSDTLKGESTITAAIAYESKPEVHPSHSPGPNTSHSGLSDANTIHLNSSEEQASHARPSVRKVVPSAFALFTLGEGLNGQPGMLHGGMMAVLFDEVLALVISSNQSLNPPAIPNMSISTAYLKTTYLKHVPTPGTVCVSARLVKSERRKHFVEGVLKDQFGTVLAKAEGLFIVLREQL